MKSNFIEWNADDVINWIRHDVKLLNLNYDLIKSHEINGRDLIDLNEDNLKEDLKILKLHDRKHLMRKICELMRVLAEANTNENSYHDNENEIENQISLDKNFEIITINIKFEEKTVAFKCANNIKVEHIIKECIDVFDLNNRNYGDIKIKNQNYSHNKEHQYNISDFYLSDRIAVIYPKENYISDIFHDYYNNNINTNRKEVLTYYLKFNKEEAIARNSISLNSNGIKKNSTNAFEVDRKHNELFKEALPNKNINMNSYDISVDRLKPKEDNNNYYKDFSITETAVKNRYVSFEALDNLEKNGYSFINKKLNSHLNKTKEEKVTINSFYNISNLNNFNEKSLKSVNSHNTSNDQKRIETKENIVLDTNKNETAHLIKSNKKKDRLDSMNIYSRKLEFDELSEKEANTKENMPESKKISSNDKIELDEYMKILSFRTSLNTTSDNFEKNKFKRMHNTPISNNQSKGNYCNREYINKDISNTSHVQNNISKNKLQNQSNEDEIENFLNTVKNRNSSTIVQSSGNKININNNNYNQHSSIHSQINPFNRNSTNNLKNIPTAKSNLRHLIYHNITTGKEGMSIDSSVIK